MRNGVVVVSVALSLALAACATMDTSRLTDPGIRRSPEPLTLLPGYDAFMVREDLVRATHAVTQTSYVNGRMTTTTVQ